jgi:5-methylcytosine-specific restriction endonuclease McrA
LKKKRRFNRLEKIALYLYADGKCELCGKELAPGWHGDHILPFSKGGQTDVINGQALCAECNLKKGAK